MSEIHAAARRAVDVTLDPRLVAATRVQLDAWRRALRAGADRVGWKLAYGIPEIEALVGADPGIGYLTSATLVPDDDRHPPTGARELRAETEVAIVLARDVGADAGATAAQEAIGGLQVALELVDTGRPPDGLEAIVAANVLHRAVRLGPATTDTALPGALSRSIVNGEVRQVAPVRAHHAEQVRAVAQLLATAGERLRAGDRVLVGSSTHVPVGPGDTVVAEIDGVGRTAPVTIA